MAPSTPKHTEGELELIASGTDNAGAYMFAIAIIVLSLLSGAGLSVAYLNDQSEQPSVVMAAR